jgi:hypothetical protein
MDIANEFGFLIVSTRVQMGRRELFTIVTEMAGRP